MKKSDIVKDLEEGKGVLAKHITWGLYLLRPDGTVGHCYAGRINPKTAEELIAKKSFLGSSNSEMNNTREAIVELKMLIDNL